LEKDEKFFDYLVSVDDLFYFAEIDFYLLDLNIFAGPIAKRDLKDIIVVSNTCGKYCFHLSNGIPIKEIMSNNKQDLSLFSLCRYLKMFKGLHDVRNKIMDDFLCPQVLNQ